MDPLTQLADAFLAAPAEDTSWRFSTFVFRRYIEAVDEIVHAPSCISHLDDAFCDCSDDQMYAFYKRGAEKIIAAAKSVGINVPVQFYAGFAIDRQGVVITLDEAFKKKAA